MIKGRGKEKRRKEERRKEEKRKGGRGEIDEMGRKKVKEEVITGQLVCCCSQLLIHSLQNLWAQGVIRTSESSISS